jgi:hypothetical protein
MFQSSPKLVVGLQWVTDGGKNACARCAEMNGQEFYFKPQSGQQSADDMPDPPLHPNCRCKTIALVDFSRFFEDAYAEAGQVHIEEEKDDEPQKVMSVDDRDKHSIVVFGLVFCRGGRRLVDGPSYRYYGGQNWQCGRNVTGMNWAEIEGLYAPPPVDDLDTIFKKHDEGYISCERECEVQHESSFWQNRCRDGCEREKDQWLVEELIELQTSKRRMAKLLEGKNQKEKEYTERYLAFAIWWFKGVGLQSLIHIRNHIRE